MKLSLIAAVIFATTVSAEAQLTYRGKRITPPKSMDELRERVVTHRDSVNDNLANVQRFGRSPDAKTYLQAAYETSMSRLEEMKQDPHSFDPTAIYDVLPMNEAQRFREHWYEAYTVALVQEAMAADRLVSFRGSGASITAYEKARQVVDTLEKNDPPLAPEIVATEEGSVGCLPNMKVLSTIAGERSVVATLNPSRSLRTESGPDVWISGMIGLPNRYASARKGYWKVTGTTMYTSTLGDAKSIPKIERFYWPERESSER